MIRVYIPAVGGLALAVLGLAAHPVPAAEAGKTADPAPFTVVASFYPMYVTALNVAAGVPAVRVENLAPPEAGCPEDYALSPADLKLLHGADVLVINGAGIEGFVDKAVAQCPQLKIVDTGAGLPRLRDGGRVNPHGWVAPGLAARQARTMAAGLAAADPAHAEAYRQNADAYARRLEALEAQMQKALAAAPTRRVVVFHDSLRYLAKALNWETVAVLEPAPGQAPNARQLAEVVTQVRAQPGPVALLTEKGAHSPAAETLGRELHQPVYALDTVVSGPPDPAAAREAYVRAMEQNTVILRQALGVPAAASL